MRSSTRSSRARPSLPRRASSVLTGTKASPDYVRVACETLITTGLVVVAGEIRTHAYVDIPKIVRETVKDIGYTRAKYGFDYETCGVVTTHRRAERGHRSGRGRVVRGPARRGRRPDRSGGRRRPGHDVRLCVQRHRRAHADADPPAHIASHSASPTCARPACSTTCAPTARPRSPSGTSTASRSRSRRSSSRRSTPSRRQRRDRDQARSHRARHQARPRARRPSRGRAPTST